MISVVHYKKSNLASAPNELVKAVNKYGKNIKAALEKWGKERKADILHFHNLVFPVKNKMCIIQYHSEPFRVNLKCSVKKALVISQYHATLPEYKHCDIVRNIIDYNTELYKQKEICHKIVVGFSPSVLVKQRGPWFDKGYKETTGILKKLKEEFPQTFDYDVIVNTPLQECILRKAKCNIIIDECMTPSFHRSGLEGLALGKMTICSLGKSVIAILKKSSGSAVVPFENVNIDNLYLFLKKLTASNRFDYVLDKGKQNRAWMETYWNPEKIVDEYSYIYKKVMSEKK